MMDLMNETVIHHRYGQGRITAQDSSSVTVEFGEEFGTKKFLCPAAFASFLELSDPLVRGKMDEELRLLREQADAERKQRELADEKRREETHGAAKKPKKAPAKRPAAKRPRRDDT